MPFKRFCISASSFFGSTAVIGGAFGAHALRYLAPDRLAIFKTAMQYQLMHAIVLLVLSLVGRQAKSKPAAIAAACFTVGTLLFSSSLSLVAIAGMRGAGAVAPLGGTALIVGWISLAFCRPRFDNASH